jgi:hypothetical protein
MTLVLKKNANFLIENCGKSPKIVIITSSPDRCNVEPRLTDPLNVAKMGDAALLCLFHFSVPGDRDAVWGPMLNYILKHILAITYINM